MTRHLFAAGAIAAVLAVPAGATTYVRMTDEALVDATPVAAVVRVEARLAAPGKPATDYRVVVEEVLKGEAPQRLTVRVPGGGAGAIRLKIHGAPSFRSGERALVLLQPAADGTWRIPHLFLGTFHEVRAGGRRVAVRNLAEVSEARLVGHGQVAAGAPEREPLRDFDAFARWIAARARGAAARPYLVEGREAEGLRQVVDPYTLFEDGDDGMHMRWFDFDGHANVPWRAYSKGQPGLGGGGYGEFQASLKAWNAEAETPIDYRYQGTTGSKNGLDLYDEVNSIVFDDPSNSLPSFSCVSGGVLAIGGPWYTSDTAVFQGEAYHAIVNADILVNSGLGCFFAASPNASKAAQELFAHELGHTLGLDHSCGDGDGPDPHCNNAGLDDALMRAFVHDDSRGARLAADDRAGLRRLYRVGANLAAPSALTAATLSASVIELAWNDNSNGESGFVVEAKTLGGSYAVVGTVGANEEGATIEGLAQATTYTFRLKATSNTDDSGYSNEASATTNGSTGTCVQDATTLCLNQGRFRVSVAWKAAAVPPGTGPGQVAPAGTDDSGLFWFFESTNWEMLVKVLNGCAANDRYWVFFAATTDVEYLVTVTDTHTGAAKQYFNAAGTAAVSQNDTNAFASCH